MLYQVPELLLVGAASSLVLGPSDKLDIDYNNDSVATHMYNPDTVGATTSAGNEMMAILLTGSPLPHVTIRIVEVVAPAILGETDLHLSSQRTGVIRDDAVYRDRLLGENLDI